ncbi:hypothetical protein AK812_SmicGene15955 [Symbiodinium microadriaticum]|uniref:Uncharacterized protein n=1 Tax=Symbiodinium microadriaticum TaxID=2951 RepID=A0A1Q9E1L3_SYMMI|nr:hypothetical protein AK812_SmicGene15955 [Symbiodinium microadriaticum]
MWFGKEDLLQHCRDMGAPVGLVIDLVNTTKSHEGLWFGKCEAGSIRDESYLPRFSKDDIEKIRRKTKEVYKISQKEGKEAKAKQVLDAWKVVDAAFAAVKARSSNKRKAETLDEAAAEREKAAALKRAAEKAASAKKAKEKAAALKKAAEKKAAEKKAAEKAAHIKKLRSEHRARLAAEKRPSYHRNQSALICKTCQQSWFESPQRKSPDMDPLSPMKENEKGLLKLILLQPPVLPEETMGEATVRVKLNLPNLQRWRKQGEEDTCDTLQCWPHSLTMWANGVQATNGATHPGGIYFVTMTIPITFIVIMIESMTMDIVSIVITIRCFFVPP